MDTPVRTELQFRLCEAMDLLTEIPRDDDGNLAEPDQAAIYLNALDQALTGDPGCVEPDEWQARRETAYMLHSHKLGFE